MFAAGERTRRSFRQNEYRTCDLRNSRAVARKPRCGKIVRERRKAVTPKQAREADLLSG
jgi:hypothetical protein